MKLPSRFIVIATIATATVGGLLLNSSRKPLAKSGFAPGEAAPLVASQIKPVLAPAVPSPAAAAPTAPATAVMAPMPVLLVAPKAVAGAAALNAFTAWTQQYLAAAPESRAALEAEGVKMASARRPVFQQLIESDPQQALDLAVPRVVRQDRKSVV